MGIYALIALLLLMTAMILRAPFRKRKRERKKDPLFCALDLLARQYAAHRNIDFKVKIDSKKQEQYFDELVKYGLVEGDSNSIDITSKGIKAVLAASNNYLSIGKWSDDIPKSSRILSMYYFLFTGIILGLPSAIAVYSFWMGLWTIIIACVAGVIVLALSIMSARASLKLYALGSNERYKRYLLTLRMSEEQL